MKRFDPVTLEIYRSLYTAVAEEMGVALRRTAHSPNIKERRDYSCAVFDARGRVIAQGDHMPVHLGSMPMAVAAAIRETEIMPGDVVALNDPFAGGTHLPDVTLVMAVDSGQWSMVSNRKETQNTRRRTQDEKTKRFVSSIRNPKSEIRNQLTTDRRPLSTLFFVANRAHHADIGGASPGSMGMARDVYGEGVRIPPVKIVRAGEIAEDVMRLVMANVRGCEERRADFEAQIGSLKTGAARLVEIVERAGEREALEYAEHLISYSSRLMRRTIAEIPDGEYAAEDYLDSDGVSDEPVRIRVKILIAGERTRVDFTGSAAQVSGPINAVEAITVSAVAYCFRCLIEADDVPASAGLVEPIEVVAPLGTVVNARHPAAVAGGNVETSQRIVDVVFKALSLALPSRIPAASQGTMNNLTIGGVDSRTGEEFAYYETIAGGMGARPTLDGLSGVHTHMTNSLNTPAEALEYAYPLRVRRYELRANSGGAGARCGGCGILREIEVLTDARASLLADRRTHAPYGLAGGADAATGDGFIVSREGAARRIEGKGSWVVKAGERVRIETPGGGGWGEET